MFKLQPVSETRWDAVVVALTFATMGLGALAVPTMPENFGVAVGLLLAGLLVAVAGALSHPRTDVAGLISLKEEGTQVLNINPMDLLKSGDAKDEDQALGIWRIRTLDWFEETLDELKRAGATKGEISDFVTVISFDLLDSPLTQPDSKGLHSALLGILATRLHRLRPIIGRLETE